MIPCRPFGFTLVFESKKIHTDGKTRSNILTIREGKHPENGEQAHQLAHTDQAVGTPDDLFFEDGTDARSGDWAVYQSL